MAVSDDTLAEKKRSTEAMMAKNTALLDDELLN
jgi:hypothetical protein